MRSQFSMNLLEVDVVTIVSESFQLYFLVAKTKDSNKK